jgi:hypothetical protein
MVLVVEVTRQFDLPYGYIGMFIVSNNRIHCTFVSLEECKSELLDGTNLLETDDLFTDELDLVVDNSEHFKKYKMSDYLFTLEHLGPCELCSIFIEPVNIDPADTKPKRLAKK